MHLSLNTFKHKYLRDQLANLNFNHANVQCASIAKTKCQVHPSKAGVGVVRLVYTMHYHSTSITPIKYKLQRLFKF